LEQKFHDYFYNGEISNLAIVW
jgi:hypothetical protein